MSTKKTWVLVADAGRARVFEKSDQRPDLVLVEGLDLHHPIPKTSDMVRDSLPRTFDSVGPGRHAITPKSDPHRAEKKDFAKTLAQILEKGRAAAAYEHLIIVAPPQMMGDLHGCLPDSVKGSLKGELLLDLTRASISEIARRLPEAKSA